MGNQQLRANVLRPNDAQALLGVCIRNNLSVLVVGEPGVGKSDVARAASIEQSIKPENVIIMHPAISDQTKFEGLPFKLNDSAASFLPFGDLKRIIEATEPTVVILEDFGQANTAVQAASMQLLHSATGERRLGDHIVPKCVTFILTSNRRTDRAGVQGILETVKSRVATIIEVHTTIDDWTEWAVKHDIAPEVIAFLRLRPELLSKFEATADMTNSPSPRTWAHVSGLMQAGISKPLQLAAFSGAVGDGAAAEFVGFLRIYETAPDLDAIMADPDKAPIPDEPSALHAVAAGLAMNTTVRNVGSVVIYAQRLFKAGFGEFSTLLMRDALRREQKIRRSVEYKEYCLSEAGLHITEANTVHQ